ncbi:MAG: hypothetical protein KJO31_07465 [Gammaproteobacteria bacterium]|nr:hypothetical protein [Gammaproteobacteria bacterium]
MLESTATRKTWQRRITPAPEDADFAGSLNELRRLGARPLLVPGSQPRTVTAGGVPLRISVSGLVQSSVPKDSLVMRLAMLLEQGVPVTLSLCNLGVGDDALRNFELFCDCLARRLPNAGITTTLIGLCVGSQSIPLRSYLDVSTAMLGDGPRYVHLDRQQLVRHRQQELQRLADRNWEFLLVQAQTVSRVLPVYGDTIRARCPLLADEAAGSVLPQLGLRVPADSAWLPVELSLADFTDGNGNLDETALCNAAHSCIDACEQILDRLAWPLPRHDWDAVNNRRLAVHLSGLGDLVAQRGDDPRDWRTLKSLERIVGRFRASLWQRSHELALSGGVLPAIHLDDPSSCWTSSEHRSAWQSRWTDALREHAVRHRNLLVLSPYSVLPAKAGQVPGFTDLLPVLHHADALSFARPPRFSGWNINEFSMFHRRAWAVSSAAKS